MYKPNQQQPQTPPVQQQGQGQVPDHRFAELEERLRRAEMQNQQLRGHIDAMAQRQQPNGQQSEEEAPFKPEVLQALERIIKKHVAPVEQALQHNVGMIYDQTDEQRYMLKYSDERWSQFQPKVERIRQEMQAQGKWISREQALQMVYFEETGKKPAPTQAKPQEAAPKFDPYFGTFVDPTTGLPIDPNSVRQGQQQPGQEDQGFPPAGQQQQMQHQQGFQGQQAPQAPAWQQPVHQQQYQQPPQQQMIPSGYGPRPQAQQNPFALPDQGINAPHMPSHQQGQRQVREISVDSSDADLAAFEKSFGDIPL